MESKKPEEEPRNKTLEATAAPPKDPPPISERRPNPYPSTTWKPLSVIPGESRNEGGLDPKPTISTSTADAASSESTADGPVTNLQKKIRRAERFGVPVQLSEEEKRSTRAERFGTGPTRTAHGGVRDAAGKQQEEEKRKARAERFGLPRDCTVDEEAKKKARLERFGGNPQPDVLEEEKRKARVIRFSGTPSSDSSVVNGKANSTLSR